MMGAWRIFPSVAEIGNEPVISSDVDSDTSSQPFAPYPGENPCRASSSVGRVENLQA